MFSLLSIFKREPRARDGSKAKARHRRSAPATGFEMNARKRKPFSSQINTSTLDEIGDVGGKLLDDRLVETLDVLEETFVFGGNKVDGDTLTTETTGTTDTVKVVFRLSGQVIVDDQRNLLDIDTTSEQIGSD